MQGLTAYLQVEDTDAAIAWYVSAFDAVEPRSRLVAPDGRCMNAAIELHGAHIMLSDANAAIGSQNPAAVGGTTVVLNLHVADADAVFARALAAGATEIFPLADQFYGDRAGRIRDPFGHHWIIATHLRDVPDAEMVSKFNEMFGG